MSIKIQLSYEEGYLETIRDVADYSSPSDYALYIMEEIFPEYAEAEQIISDGDRWYIEGVAEARWFEND